VQQLSARVDIIADVVIVEPDPPQQLSIGTLHSSIRR